jgi:hypothetical protein
MYSSGSVIVAAEVLPQVGTSVIANLNAVSLIGFQMITVVDILPGLKAQGFQESLLGFPLSLIHLT